MSKTKARLIKPSKGHRPAIMDKGGAHTDRSKPTKWKGIDTELLDAIAAHIEENDDDCQDA
jgi:hypothetical protein